MQPEATGRPAYHPSTMLKIYLYGYLNRVQSSRRIERETQRNVELMWLTGALVHEETPRLTSHLVIPYQRILTEDGMPSLVIRLSTLHPTFASAS